MGIIIKQSIQNTLISYIGIGLGFISTILMFPNILSADQFGLTRVLFSLALVGSQFAHLGLKNVIVRFFPWFETGVEKSRLLTLSLTLSLVGFLLFTFIYFLNDDWILDTFGDRTALFQDYHLYLLPLLFGVLFFEVLNSYVRALQDSVTGTFINEVFVRCLIILLLGIYLLDVIGFPLFMLFFVLIYGLQPLLLLGYLFKKGELVFASPLQGTARTLAGKIGAYSIYSLLGGLSTQLVGNIDIIMLGSLSGLASSGIYGIAFYIGTVITVPQRSIGKIATPILAGMLKENATGEIETLYKRTSINQLVAGGVIFALIWVNLHQVFRLLPEEYSAAYWVVIVIGLAKLTDMVAGINGGIILNSRFYRVDLYTNLMLVLISIVTNLILIPVYGILGAAIATALSLLIYNAVKYFFVLYRFSMQPFTGKTLLTVLFLGLSISVALAVPQLPWVIDLFSRTAIIGILFLFPVWRLKLSPDVNELLNSGVLTVKNLIQRKPE